MDGDLSQRAAAAPTGPGVYLMRDSTGVILYVGKAVNLRRRLSDYFRSTGHAAAKVDNLVARIAEFETVVTRTEKEALILESTLIKRHLPRYNVTLKDDKRYPSLRLDPKEEYPRFTIVRKAGEDDALYFGPFASATAVRETLKIINKTFKLRKCKAGEFKTRTRPCLHCQMNGCLAPCCRDVPREVYQEQVQEAVLFLKGRTRELMRKIGAQMQQASDSQEYERAARLRDKLFALERTVEKQIAVTTDFQDRDVFAAASDSGAAVVTHLAVRGGFLTGTRHFRFPETLSTAEETLAAFLGQFYGRRTYVPAEILVFPAIGDAALIAEELSGIRGARVRIHRPERGEKARIAELALQNAEAELKALIGSRDSSRDILLRLQKRLNLSRFPERIECVDNSTLMGSEPVAALVVFTGGRPQTAAYRKYGLKTVDTPDDYAAMSEILSRRLRDDGTRGDLPDLLMVDGGRGQLGAAAAVMRDLNLAQAFDLVAIAKKDERKGEVRDKIFLPGRSNPVNFGRENDLLLFLQRVRDEAHRFAVSFHRQRRRAALLRSALDDIPGIGKARKALLIRHFGTVDGIRAAAVDDISGLPGFTRNLAETVRAALNANGENP